MRLLPSLILPEDVGLNKHAIGRGEYQKMLEEEPWRQFCNWPALCECERCKGGEG